MNDSEEISIEEGYLSEVSYTHRYHEGQDPATISFLAAINCANNMDTNESFRYFELGCGNGVTVNALAAANPHAVFYANDLSEEHCRNARELAEAGQVDNVEILQASFADLLESDFKPFDIITLHGIYTWVSRDNRSQLVAFLRRFLKPNGLVYISYNCSPGNAGFVPVRQFLNEMMKVSEGDFDQRVKGAFNFLWDASGSMPFFNVFGREKNRLSEFAKKNRNYVIHELFTKDWTLFFHKEVAEELAPAGLTYFANRDVVQNFPEYLMSGDTLKQYRSIEDIGMAEMFSDLALGRQFRKDLFIRNGGGDGERLSQRVLLEGRWIALAKPREEMTYREKIQVGFVTLQRMVYEPIIEALEEGPQSVASLLSKLHCGEEEESTFFKRLLKLVAFGYVAPCFSLDRIEGKRQSALRFNRAIMGRRVNGVRHDVMVSPVLGAGVPVPRIEQFFIRARNEGLEPIAFALRQLEEGGLSLLNRSGDVLKGEEECLAEIEARFEKFRSRRLDWYRYLGLVGD